MPTVTVNLLDISDPSKLFDCENPKQRFRDLVQQYHPDTGGSDKEFVHLKELWEKYKTSQELHMDNFWKVGNLHVASTAFVKGEKANFYKVHDPEHPKRPLALRIPRNGIDSGNAEKIIKVVNQVSNCHENYDFSAFLPRIHNALNITLNNNTKRKSLLMRRMVGWCTLRQVLRDAGKLHILDSAWIIRRIFAIAGAFREAGLTHGNLNLDHILIEPDLHGLAVAGLSDVRFKQAPEIDAKAASIASINITDMETVPRQMEIFLRNLDLKPVEHMWTLREEFDEMLMKATNDRLRFREFRHDVTTID